MSWPEFLVVGYCLAFCYFMGFAQGVTASVRVGPDEMERQRECMSGTWPVLIFVAEFTFAVFWPIAVANTFYNFISKKTP